MRSLLPDDILRRVKYRVLLEYLKYTSWELQTSPKGKWLIFRGSKDVYGEPLEIVLPQNSNATDLPWYISNAVGLLAALANESAETIANKIRYYDHDVLKVRNIETGQYDSIALRLASTQVSQLKSLVAFGACSEYDPRPFFEVSNTVVARQMIDHYRFGHTFRGSFGYTIESAVSEPSRYVQESYFEQIEDFTIAPPERRVMERIVRGLVITREAIKSTSPRVLVDGYSGGFNGNMCKALVKMGNKRTSALEYAVDWSVKIQPSEDVRDPGTIQLDRESYSYLDQAAKELSTYEPVETTIIGRVTNLVAKDNPLGSEEIPRSVVIRWLNRGARPVSVLVYLNREDYVVAHDAHLRWLDVEVKGVVQRVGSTYRLANPHDFRLWG